MLLLMISSDYDFVQLYYESSTITHSPVQFFYSLECKIRFCKRLCIPGQQSADQTVKAWFFVQAWVQKMFNVLFLRLGSKLGFLSCLDFNLSQRRIQEQLTFTSNPQSLYLVCFTSPASLVLTKLILNLDTGVRRCTFYTLEILRA